MLSSDPSLTNNGVVIGLQSSSKPSSSSSSYNTCLDHSNNSWVAECGHFVSAWLSATPSLLGKSMWYNCLKIIISCQKLPYLAKVPHNIIFDILEATGCNWLYLFVHGCITGSAQCPEKVFSEKKSLIVLILKSRTAFPTQMAGKLQNYKWDLMGWVGNINKKRHQRCR